MNSRKIYKRRLGGGFTLLEALFAAMLIGLVIASLAVSSSAFTQANAVGTDLSTAEFLIEEIRELTAPAAFSDLTGFAGNSQPPIDAAGNAMNEFSAFTQNVTVVPCGDEFSAAANEDIVRVTVTILKNGQTLNQANWIRADLE
jgi:type II secretory pathway pseudopilin PulG